MTELEIDTVGVRVGVVMLLGVPEGVEGALEVWDGDGTCDAVPEGLPEPVALGLRVSLGVNVREGVPEVDGDMLMLADALCVPVWLRVCVPLGDCVRLSVWLREGVPVAECV